MRYAGVCYDSGGSGGDLTGLLVKHLESQDRWVVLASHISSTEGWAKRDIEDKARKLAVLSQYEWLGLMTGDEIRERFGWRNTPRTDDFPAE